MAAGLVLLLAAACGTLDRPHTPDRTLPPQDVAQSQAWAHYALGLLLEADQGRGTPAALQAFENARDLDPESRQPSEALALNLLKQARNEDALKVLEERCRRQPDSVEAHLALARTAELIGAYPRAAEHYGAAFDLQPDNLSPAFGRIRCLFSARRDREALRAMRRLHDRTPNEATRQAAVLWASQFLQRQKEPLRALPCLELAAEWATNNAARATYLAAQAEALINLGRTNDAQRTFQRALVADGRCTLALQGSGFLLAARHDTQAIERLVAKAPGLADPLPNYLVAAFAYDGLGVQTQVVAVLTAARDTLRLRQLPVPEMVFLQLGACLDELEQDQEAAAVFQDALTACPQAHAIMNHLAYMWAVNNTHLEEAARLAQSALALSPGSAAYIDTLGWVRYRQKQYTEALVLLLQAIQIMGEDPVVLDHVGDTLAALDRLPEALAYWSRSFVLDADQPGLSVKLQRHGLDPASLISHAPPKARD